MRCDVYRVLNLVINGLPSIPHLYHMCKINLQVVLNLVINGLPSIPTINKGLEDVIKF